MPEPIKCSSEQAEKLNELIAQATALNLSLRILEEVESDLNEAQAEVLKDLEYEADVAVTRLENFIEVTDDTTQHKE